MPKHDCGICLLTIVNLRFIDNDVLFQNGKEMFLEIMKKRIFGFHKLGLVGCRCLRLIVLFVAEFISFF